MARYRKKRIIVTVTEEEKKEYLQKMKLAGMSNISEFARKLFVYGTVINVDVKGLNDLAYEINRIGNNINQIAKRVNETGNLYEQDIEEIKEKLTIISDFIEATLVNLRKAKGGL